MKPLFKKIAIVSLLLLSILPLYSQLTRNEFVSSVQDADKVFYFNEDYEKAASMYLDLHDLYPNNYNLSAKLGICYLNIPGKNSEALENLIFASANIVENDNKYVEYGEKAPLDTYLYLAIAYHQNDSLKKAIKLYTAAKERLGKTKLFRDEYIEKQIQDCRYALEMEKNPQKVKNILFINWLSDYPGSCNPVLSKNDSVFIFTQKKDGKTHIFCSFKTDKWKQPTEITRQLGGGDELYSNSMTGDGKLLIFYKLDGVDGNLYYSQRKDSTWSRIKSLNINTIYWESHGFITPDGKTLYFASNRPGGEGELDIWVSERADNGTWKKPVNCGDIINTPYNENTPFFDPVANTLYFSSIGHASMGNYDVFRSVREKEWTKPVGLPFALNNTSENLFYILNSKSSEFITSIYNEREKSLNIYSLQTTEPADKTIRAQGTISLTDGMAVDPDQTNIQLADQKTGVVKKLTLESLDLTKYEVKPGNFKTLISPIRSKSDSIDLAKAGAALADEEKALKDTGVFKFEIKPGDYTLYVSHKGYKTDTINLNIPSNFSSTFIPVNASLIPDKVFSGDFLAIKNIPFDYDSYKLTDKAIASLEVLKSILLEYPELNIEVAGYTDSKGSSEYNKRLADNRAQAVIDYLAADGIAKARFVKEALGASDFIAINTNKDGTDNPEGRRYNRRAAFGIINPKTGIVIRQETYTPEHLKQIPPPEKKATQKKTTTGTTVKATGTNVKNIVAAGKDKPTTVPKQQTKPVSKAAATNAKPAPLPTISGEKPVYTIQISASKKQIDVGQFKNVNGVMEIKSDDGYYRYLYGEFETFATAKAAASQLHKSGYPNAFIRNLNLLSR
jgi:outer membrane protein OmpA-like peptidoglycan-associated protein